MKRMILVILVAMVATGLLVAQGFVSGLGDHPQPYARIRSPRIISRPALSVAEAYTLALSELGAVSNKYYCVAANCLNDLPATHAGTNHSPKGWTFGFSNPAGDRVRVFVYFDKATDIDPITDVLQ